MKVNILVPMAGKGSRFANAGFVQPKPLIDVAGKPMISWVIDNVNAPGVIEARFIFLVLREHEKQYGRTASLKSLVKSGSVADANVKGDANADADDNANDNAKFNANDTAYAATTTTTTSVEVVYVDEVTEGAACTCLLARGLIDDETPLFIANSDQFVEWSAVDYWTSMAQQLDSSDGDVLCFRIPMSENDVKWSYAKVDERGCVTDLQEKKVISENATVGYYYWRRGSDFVRLADKMIARDFRVNGEFYVAPVYNEGVAEGMKFKLSFCDKMWGLGVPHDLTSFLTNYVRARRPKLPPPASIACGPMRFIAHRGNVYGANKEKENRPEYIKQALALGFDVEIDVWYLNDHGGSESRGGCLEQESFHESNNALHHSSPCSSSSWWLGHDEPQYMVPYEFLLQSRLWIHCKNGAALRMLSQEDRVNCFSHDVDECTLTSKRHVWVYPDKPLQGPSSVAVMFSDPVNLLDKDIFGICADDVGVLRHEYVQRRLRGDGGDGKDADIAAATASATSAAGHASKLPSPKIQLIVFDLDGVLVESKDLHYEALNEAIRAVAGEDFVITRPEHETVYDGLSTNQKLRLMTIQKDLPLDMHRPIWLRKQELTEVMVRDQLKPDGELLATIRALKKEHGYPLAVASNCIKSSVFNILDSIGVLPLVDAYFSNEDVQHAKPAPDIYLKACSTFGVPPESALVVEDSVKGFEACVRAGCPLFKVRGPEDVRVPSIVQRVSAINQGVKPITVVVPLAGESQQYWIDGPEAVPSELPLFLSDVNGAPAIEWVLKPFLQSRYELKFVFVVKESQMQRFKLESLLPRIVGFRPTVVLPVHGETLGSLKTVLSVAEKLDGAAPVIFCNGSTVTSWLPGSSIDDLVDTRADGALTTFESNDPKCSYVRVRDGTDLVDVHEKVPVSNIATTGIYYWKSADAFLSAATSIVKRGVKHKGLYYMAPVYNEAVRAGLSFKILPAKGCWPLCSLQEVSKCAEAHVSLHVDEEMKGIYDELEERQNKSIAELGYTFDASLKRQDQPARCFAAYTLCSFENFHSFSRLDLLMGQLQESFGTSHAIYRVRPDCDSNHTMFGRLHLTFMQLVGFEIFGSVPLPHDYAEVIEAILLRSMRPFEVHFTRVVLTRGSLMLVGHPTSSLNHVRDTVRKTLARIGYPLYEPYKNDIVHMTLMRFAAPLSSCQARKLEAIVHAQPRGKVIAKLRVDALTMSAASWKMQPAELEAVPRHHVCLA